MAPFVKHLFPVAPTIASVAPAVGAISHTSSKASASDSASASKTAGEQHLWVTRHATVRSFRLGIKLCLELVQLFYFHSLQAAVDAMVMILADVAGLPYKLTARVSFFYYYHC